MTNEDKMRELYHIRKGMPTDDVVTFILNRTKQFTCEGECTVFGKCNKECEDRCFEWFGMEWER